MDAIRVEPLLRRVTTSKLLLAAMIAIAAAVLTWSTHALGQRVQARADGQAQRTGELVAAFVHRDVSTPHAVDGRLDAAEAARLDADVQALRGSDQLLGVRVWRQDGTRLFTDTGGPSAESVLDPTLSAEQLDRARAGRPWTEPAPGVGAGSADQILRVFVPLSSGGAREAPPTGLVEILVPRPDVLGGSGGRLWRQQLGAIVILLLFTGGMLGLRRSLLARDRQARHDPLTGLLNRRAFLEDADGLLKKADAQRPAALLVIDLDDFKTINDTLGHAAGDLLLQQLATTLQAGVRAGDLLIRLGGDEFAVLLAGMQSVTPLARAQQLLTRIRATAFPVAGVGLTVDASIGVALAPQHGTDLPTLLQRADVAMYQAKNSRSGAAVYDPTVDAHTVGQLTMLTELHQALANDEFVLHYQPKVGRGTEQVTSVEALVRWQHPTRGLLAPGVFLPLVEGTPLMRDLTRWVLRAALQQAASWMRAGMPLQVSVNISPQSLLEDDLPARVMAALLWAEVPPNLLRLEVTETAVTTDPEQATAILRQLHARGVSIAIDDFGAGYTSLAHLRTLPVAELKIDRSMVVDLLDQPADEAVTQAMIDLGHRLGFTVVAEGVETEPLLRRLTHMGCDHVQGYVHTPPLHPTALEGWITDRASRADRPAAAAQATAPHPPAE